jgi:aerobic C4-dicarboxylate transport protein
MKFNLFRHLYFYVLIAIIAGIIVGHFNPGLGKNLKVLSEYFINLIKLVIGPIIFLTVTLGIANLKDLKQAGRVGLKSFLYFESVTTLALIIGLTIVNIIQPGKGFNKKPESLKIEEVNHLIGPKKESSENLVDKIIPTNIIDPFAKGEILQILFIAILTGAAISNLKEQGHKIAHGLELISKVVFKIVSYLMYLAPIGAFGAMAYTIGYYGIDALIQLGKLMLCVYLTCVGFIIIVLGTIAWKSGFSIFKFINFIKEEIFIVFGTSSSESALPRMMEKMEQLGCSKTVTGLVIPTGYSFNLDGTSIYLTMAAVFIAQATNTPLTLGQELVLIGTLMLTSKGAAAVTGGGLVTLAATLAAMDSIPLAGLTLVIGVDRFMSEARAITNLIGNGVASVVISNWEKETDLKKLKEALGES